VRTPLSLHVDVQFDNVQLSCLCTARPRLAKSMLLLFSIAARPVERNNKNCTPEFGFTEFFKLQISVYIPQILFQV
jgi:hypothetical protein